MHAPSSSLAQAKQIATDRIAVAARVALGFGTVLLLLYAASLLAASFSHKHYVQIVDRALDSGALQSHFQLPLGSRETVYRFNLNDCLILDKMMLSRDKNVLLRALSPSQPLGREVAMHAPLGLPPAPQCADLVKTINFEKAGRQTPPDPYHRYLHGDWVAAELLLSILPFPIAASVLFAVLAVEIAVLGILASNRLRRGANRARDAAYATLSIAMLIFWLSPAYDFSFSFAPTDIVVAALLLLLFLRPISRMPDRELATVCSVFGALIAVFEFLTGGIPSGLSAILICIALDSWDSEMVLINKLLLAIASFSIAVAACFAIKVIAVGIIFGMQPIIRASEFLTGHMGDAAWGAQPVVAEALRRLGLSVQTIRDSRLFASAYGLFKMVYFTSRLAYGSLTLGVGLTVIAPLALCARIAFTARRMSATERLRALVAFGVPLVLLAWCLIFVQHTIVHAYFMYRILIWPVLALTTFEVARRFSPHPQTGTLGRLPD